MTKLDNCDYIRLSGNAFMGKSFFELLDGLECQLYGGDNNVIDLNYDSRKITQGSVFFALSGLHTTGENYIESAIKNGAVAIVYEKPLSSFQKGVSYAKVKNARVAMSYVANKFYDDPSSKLKVIGVTGTEGKSSTVSFIWQLLNLCGKKCGYFSTVSYSYGSYNLEKKNPEHQTTPESITVQKHLYKMLENGCEYAVVEASSHGLSDLTARLLDVKFDVGVFMNVTEEHLEFHKTFENYRFDKANLFRKLDEHNHTKKGSLCKSFGVVNLDDVSAEYFAQATNAPIYGFKTTDIKSSFIESLDYVLTAFKITENTSSLNFLIDEKERCSNEKTVENNFVAQANLLGIFNVKNIFASLITVSKITEKKLIEILPLLPKLKAITGRMFFVNEGQNFTVLIDYAHTPSSFEVIMPALSKKAKDTGTKLIAVFGSGGERDKVKRPQQGRIASKYCDILVLTDEDPRAEGSMPVIKMIADGVKNKELNKNLFLISDRKKAIRKAFSLCKAGDTVLLLGKGHENTIIYADYAMPYDEETEARKALKEMKKNCV